MKKFAILLFINFYSCQSEINSSIQGMDIFEILKNDSITNNQKDEILDHLNANLRLNKGLKLNHQVASNQYESIQKELDYDDLLLKLCVDALSLNPKEYMGDTVIDCENLDQLFNDMLDSDRKVRQEGGDMNEVDNKNRSILINIIESCGWIEERTKQIWWLSHHNMREFIPYYYPEFRKRVGKHNLLKANLAFMEDRMLVNAGYPQIYGTQSINGKLYNIIHPEDVNERRKNAGIRISEDKIKTIEMECERLGLIWKDELKRMKEIEKSPIQNGRY